MIENDDWQVYGKTLKNRLFLGTAQYPSPQVMRQAVEESGAEVITLSLRRQNPSQGGGAKIWHYIQEMKRRLLPNTAGCHTVKEAVTLAHMSRELLETDWIKLEIICDDYALCPDGPALVEAARILTGEGFKIFPYCTEDISICSDLLEAGCEVLMPWGSPIGSGRGLMNAYALKLLRATFSDAKLIVDAGIGAPSHASRAMELGFDGVLINTAVAKATHPPAMARAFSQAVRAGRGAYLAGIIPRREKAHSSTPTVGMPFWHEEKN